MPITILEQTYTLKLTKPELQMVVRAVEQGVTGNKEKYSGKWAEVLLEFVDLANKEIGITK